MKKLVSVSLAAAMVASMTACGSNNTAETTAAAAAETTAAAGETSAAAESATAADLSLIHIQMCIRDSTTPAPLAPLDGNLSWQ